MPTPIYHITHINNLRSIVENEGLLSHTASCRKGIRHTSIAHQNIQDRRAFRKVPCGRGGVLHDYVPFYFAPRSPMLYTISRGNVVGYDQGQTPVIYLVSSAEAVEAAELPFVGADGHAVMEYTGFFDDLYFLEYVIDWEIMEATFWADTDEDGDRKRRRQAEFLVHNFFPWRLITEIGVINSQIQTQVREILQNYNYKPPVKVYPNWYY